MNEGLVPTRELTIITIMIHPNRENNHWKVTEHFFFFYDYDYVDHNS